MAQGAKGTPPTIIRAPLYMNTLPMMPREGNGPLGGASSVRTAGATLSLAQLLNPPNPAELAGVAGLPVKATTSSSSSSSTWDILLLSNYMIDLEWLLEVSGGQEGFLRVAVPIVTGQTRFQLLYGESSKDHLVAALNQASAKAASLGISSSSGGPSRSNAGGWTKTATLTKPNLPLAFGTHHTKALVAVKAKVGIRVGIFTANFIKDDWERKNQGLYVQDFPWVSSTATASAAAAAGASAHGEAFRQELVAYLKTAGTAADILQEIQKSPGTSRGVKDGYFDFSAVQGRLVSSTPGYHQVGGGGGGAGFSGASAPAAALPPFHPTFRPLGEYQGMERLKKVLAQEAVDPALLLPHHHHYGPPPGTGNGAHNTTCLSWQYSSQGSLTDRFLTDLQEVMNTTNSGGIKPFDVMAAKSKKSSGGGGISSSSGGGDGVRVVFPTESEVRHSVEGWRGGSSIPVPVKNAHEFINARYHKFGCPLQTPATPTSTIVSSSTTVMTPGKQLNGGEPEYHPRTRAMPHIKSYLRLISSSSSSPSSSSSRLQDVEGRGDHSAISHAAWVLVTSSNLSRAAWGDYQKNNSQLAIRSYELGILFTAQTVLRGRNSVHAGFSMMPVPNGIDFAPLQTSKALGLSTSLPASHGLWPVRLATTVGPGSQVSSSPYSKEEEAAVYLTLPYNPGHPQPYGSTEFLRQGLPLTTAASRRDVPWMVDAPHRGPDVMGQEIGSALGEYSHYGPGSWHATTLNFEHWTASGRYYTDFEHTAKKGDKEFHPGVMSLQEQQLSRDLEAAIESSLSGGCFNHDRETPAPPSSSSSPIIPSGAQPPTTSWEEGEEEIIIISSDSDDEVAEGGLSAGSGVMELVGTQEEEGNEGFQRGKRSRDE